MIHYVDCAAMNVEGHKCNCSAMAEHENLKKSCELLRQESEGWKAKFLSHTEAVARFVAEMYAIMIDPLESADQDVKDTCAALIEQAKQDRESLREFHELKAEIDSREHVAYLRYRNNTRFDSQTIQTCDQDAEGAFKVYRRPTARLDRIFQRLSAEAKMLYESIMDAANENDNV